MISSILVACVLAANPEAVPSPDLAAYKEAKAQAGRNTDAHIRLALWCEAHGMNAERTKHLTIATLIDPANPTARGLLGMVQHKGKWLSPDAVAEQLRNDPQQQAIVREYLERRAKSPDKPDEQMKLALWCEQNGLKDQAQAHFHRTVQLDPGREQAWKHLGYKKEKGRWVRTEQIAAEQELIELQIKANKHWKPILDKLRTGLASKKAEEREKAQLALDEIRDPMAVPAIWATFAQGNANRQAVAVRLFSQIDGPGASRALALLAMQSPSQDIRRDSVEQLKRKDPRDFADVFIAQIRKPIEYEVRQKVGVDTPGELFIKGKDQNWRKIFRPLSMPDLPILSFQEGGIGPDSLLFMYDDNGLPVVRRSFNRLSPLWFTIRGTSLNPQLGPAVNVPFVDASRMTSVLQQGGLNAQDAQKLGQTIATNANSPVNRDLLGMALDPWGQLGINPYPYLDIPVGQMALDVQRSAQAAQFQLESEVKKIEDYNRPIREMNRRARQYLVDSTGVDLGDNPEAWQRWFVDVLGLAVPPAGATSQTTTTIEDVPLDFQPSVDPRIIALAQLSPYSCFAAGTAVRTVDGFRPIESIEPGDRILVQDTQTGRIAFSPVLNTFHNPPNLTLKINFTGNDEPIVATGIHRFWKAGQGWVMARDLKSGDVLRTVGGSVTVRSIETDKKQPVFNLLVAEEADFFVGSSGILAHDNSLVTPAEKPFDHASSKENPVR